MTQALPERSIRDGVTVTATLDSKTLEGTVQLNIDHTAFDYRHPNNSGLELTPDEARSLARLLLDAVDNGIPSIRAIV